jgi:hypothetical protein
MNMARVPRRKGPPRTPVVWEEDDAPTTRIQSGENEPVDGDWEQADTIPGLSRKELGLRDDAS